MSKLDHEVIIRSGKYSDGSGHAAEARVFDEGFGDGVCVEIAVVYRLTANEWQQLRNGIEAAVTMLAEASR